MTIRSFLPALEAALLLSAWVATQSVSAQAPKAATDALVGTWTGPLSAAGAEMTFVFQLKADDKGNLQGTLTVPEQGGVSLPMTDVQFADNKFNFKIAPVAGEFTSTYANGVLNGQWRQGGQPDGVPVVLKKGAYVAQVHVLKLDAESFGKLAGTWKGEWVAPNARYANHGVSGLKLRVWCIQSTVRSTRSSERWYPSSGVFGRSTGCVPFSNAGVNWSATPP